MQNQMLAQRFENVFRWLCIIDLSMQRKLFCNFALLITDYFYTVMV